MQIMMILCSVSLCANNKSLASGVKFTMVSIPSYDYLLFPCLERVQVVLTNGVLVLARKTRDLLLYVCSIKVVSISSDLDVCLGRLLFGQIPIWSCKLNVFYSIVSFIFCRIGKILIEHMKLPMCSSSVRETRYCYLSVCLVSFC